VNEQAQNSSEPPGSGRPLNTQPNSSSSIGSHIGSDGNLHRGLKPRHIQLIALGGIIGSCYFLGTGAVVSSIGPAACLAYVFGGLIIYLTMLCMGELAVAIPTSGSFVNYASDFISPSFACGVGWSYWINWIAYIPAECLAAGIIMHAFTGVSSYLWAVAFGLLITFINLSHVKIFGEIEFWLAIVKISALFGFTFLSIFIFFGLIHGDQPSHIIGAHYLYDNKGLFPNGWTAFLTGMVLLLVNYQGSEIIGLAAGESQNPMQTIPRAIKTVTLRILLIYIIPVFFLVVIFPWQKAGLSQSVFADALSFYGLKWAGIVISFVTVSAAISCSNSGFYGTVRAMLALSRKGMAPKALSKLNRHYMPQRAVFLTLFGVWGILLTSYFFGDTSLYLALLLVSGFTGTLCWIGLCWAQINFRRRLISRGYSIKDLKYKTPGSPYTGILAIVLMLACLLFLFFAPDPTYKIAFGIGSTSLILPIIVYKLFSRFKPHWIKPLQAPGEKPFIGFDVLFPPKDPQK